MEAAREFEFLAPKVGRENLLCAAAMYVKLDNMNEVERCLDLFSKSKRKIFLVGATEGKDLCEYCSNGSPAFPHWYTHSEAISSETIDGELMELKCYQDKGHECERIQFDETKWKDHNSLDGKSRMGMLEDLILRVGLSGKKRSEIHRLLGQPRHMFPIFIDQYSVVQNKRNFVALWIYYNQYDTVVGFRLVLG
jgi:hypothetical protein